MALGDGVVCGVRSWLYSFESFSLPLPGLLGLSAVGNATMVHLVLIPSWAVDGAEGRGHETTVAGVRK